MKESIVDSPWSIVNRIVHSPWSMVHSRGLIVNREDLGKSLGSKSAGKSSMPNDNPKRLWTMDHGLWTIIILLLSTTLFNCATPKERIVLRDIKDVIVDAADEPTLRANAIFYNPNNMRMRLKKIDVEVFVEGKKVANVNQELKTIIPAHDEFSVPLQVKLAMKDLGFVNTLFGMLGAKKLEVQYKGFLKLTYHGIPIRVPVDYKDQIRFKF